MRSSFISLAETLRLRHDLKPLSLIAQIQRSLVPMNVYNVLPKGLKSPLMCVTYRLQVLDSFLEHIACASQSLDLIFEAFD